MKLTFHKNAKVIDNGLVLRINIPGLEIYPVSFFLFFFFCDNGKKQDSSGKSRNKKIFPDENIKISYLFPFNVQVSFT